MGGERSILYQCHISSTIYHARTDWLQYHINLFTRVPVDFQQEKILFSTIGLTFKFFSGSLIAPGILNVAYFVLLLFLCWKYI